MSRATPQPTPHPEPVYYPVKWVLNEKGSSVPICMQARNGPCPLLALANINLQTRSFTLEPGTTRMREEHLMAILADYVSTRPTSKPTDSSVLREHAIADFLDLLPRLNRGMDINVRFDSPTSFEFTRELGVFDIFPSVRLLHGWLVDPQDVRLASALGKLSYNQVIDELVRTASPAPPPPPEQGEEEEESQLRHVPSAPPPEAFEPTAPPSEVIVASVATDAVTAASPGTDDVSQYTDISNEEVQGEDSLTGRMPELPEETRHTSVIREVRPFVIDFLESNSTQLTVYGLTELHSSVADGETFILFRNSHFYVVKKRGGELFTLVTDVGYLHELNTVWEKLSDVNGDSTFYNGSFQRITGHGVVEGGSGSAAPQKAQRPPSAGCRPTQTIPQQPAHSTGCGSSAMQQPVAPYMATRPMAAMPSTRRSTSGSVGGKPKNSEKCVIQ